MARKTAPVKRAARPAKPKPKAVKTPPRKTGRPSSYTELVGAVICARLSEGESLRSICADGGMPDKATVFRWLGVHEFFRDQYARAREAQADRYAEEIVEIADEADDANKARLQIDARKWVASKLLAKKYGDRTQMEHSGPDGGAIPISMIQLVPVDPE